MTMLLSAMLSPMVSGCSESSSPPLVLLTATPEGGQQGVVADSALELTFAEVVNEGDLDGIVLIHDGVEEHGRWEVEGNIAHYWPDNGWFVGTTYEVNLPGMEDVQGEKVLPWMFTTGTWRQVEATPTCGASVRNPSIATTENNTVMLFGTDYSSGNGCLMQWSQETWQPPIVLPGKGLFDKRLLVPDDAEGLAMAIATESRTLFVSTVDGDAVLEEPIVARYAADLSSTGKGLIAWAEEQAFGDHLRVRRVDGTTIGDAELLFESTNNDVHLSHFATAAGETGALAVAWIRTSYQSDQDTVFLATSDGTSAWDIQEIHTVPVVSNGAGKHSSMASLQLSIADDGRMYMLWQQQTGFGSRDGEVWAVSFDDEKNATIGKLVDLATLSPLLVSSGTHVAAVWAEGSGDDRQLAVLRVVEGAWDSTKQSSAELRPSSDLGAAIDAVGHLVFTWMEGNTLCIGRHHESSWDKQCEFSPQPSFTSPVASIAVTDRGRAFLAWFGGDTVELATFD